MRSDWVDPVILEHILAALTPQNRLAMRVSLATGLRIGDVLQIKSAQIVRGNRFTVREQKTGKGRRIYLPELLRQELLADMGRYYVFEGRCDPRRPRTRQAVWKDLHRAAKLFRCKKAVCVSPHTARKVFAVDAFKSCGSIEKVQRLLNHGDPAVTMLYAMAEEVTRRKLHGETDPRKPGKRKTAKSPRSCPVCQRNAPLEGRGGDAPKKP